MRVINFLCLLCVFAISLSHAKAQNAVVKGIAMDTAFKQPIVGAVVLVENKPSIQTLTNQKGEYELSVPSNVDIVLVLTSNSQELGVEPRKSSVLRLAPKQVMDYPFYSTIRTLTGVEVPSNNLDVDTFTTLKPVRVGDFNKMISIGGGVEALLVTQPGFYQQNPLSSAFSVRGGNYDENLLYLNGIETYRPFLVRSGQQEGFSTINPDMVDTLSFSSGGWEAKYGDKLSSVITATYKDPDSLSASITAGLLTLRAHVEGSSDSLKKWSYVFGLRRKNTGSFLNGNSDISGEYRPLFFDVQAFMTYHFGKVHKKKSRTSLSFLFVYSRNRFQVVPSTRESTLSTFTQTVRLTVAFDGKESMSYDSYQTGLNFKHRFSKAFDTELILSAVSTQEREYTDLEGGYLLCDVNKDLSSDQFNECALVRGLGTLYQYSRNKLNAQILSAENKYRVAISKASMLTFGVRAVSETIQDKVYEYSFTDSADYVEITGFLESQANLSSQRMIGYLQASHKLESKLSGNIHSITYGVRSHYWTLNQQLLISPRLQYIFIPRALNDEARRSQFYANMGVYSQPAFYREMRAMDGSVNTSLKAQSSFHSIVGAKMSFYAKGRPLTFVAEAYYKHLWNVVPYDVDNIRVRYYALNNAKAYVWGADMKLSGEFIKGTESWVSLGILSTKEDVEGDARGYIRRPSDQRFSFATYIEDHLPKIEGLKFDNQSIRFNMTLMYGSGFPYGPPNLYNLRQMFRSGTSYRRFDVGFSKLLVKDRKTVGSTVYKRPYSIWFGLNIINALGTKNTLSFTWIKDFYDVYYAIPNSLSQRFWDFKIYIRY